jgi:hypothetical protein
MKIPKYKVYIVVASYPKNTVNVPPHAVYTTSNKQAAIKELSKLEKKNPDNHYELIIEHSIFKP